MGFRGQRSGLLLLVACLHAPAGLAADKAVPVGEPTYELSCGGALTVWRKARDPGARECCALVVRARAGLWTSPGRSRELAERAVALCPVGLEAVVALGAAHLAEGRGEEAHRIFERALSGKSAETWLRLAAGERLLAARAASVAGSRKRALEHYRSVILELDQLPSPHERARVLLEGALLAARVSPPELAEAQAYLRQSADHLSPRLHAVRRLVALAIAPRPAPGEQGSKTYLQAADLLELVTWMQAGGQSPRGAPGELLPTVEAAILRELLPLEAEELEALP